jgi:RNA polymerase sigma-70 factor (ECF subfamily)
MGIAQQPALTIEKLHREHGDRIRRYLARLVGATEAEDLEQDVFEKAQRAIGTFRGDSRLLTWLYRVATNAAIDRLRSTGRRADLEGDGAAADRLDADGRADASADRPLDGELDRTRMRECIMRVVEQLPASQRAVILLGELRGLDDREMADALGISLGAAKIRLHRARRALKAELERACSFERDGDDEFTCAPKVGSLVSLGRRR